MITHPHTKGTDIELVIPDDCKGCGACCRVFAHIPITDDAVIPPEFLDEIPPMITEHGMVARHKLAMVDFWGADNKCGICAALDQDTNMCTIHGSAPRVCEDFARNSLSCRIALLMINHGLNHSDAHMWPHHHEFIDDPDGSFHSEPSSAFIRGRCMVRHTLYYGYKFDPRRWDRREFSPWTCRHCFAQADWPEKIKHGEDCVPIEPTSYWKYLPWRWAAIKRWEAGQLKATMPGLGCSV